MNDKEIAAAYCVCPSQICEWKSQGAPIGAPRNLLRWFADRGGRQPALFWRLFDSAEIEILENQINPKSKFNAEI